MITNTSSEPLPPPRISSYLIFWCVLKTIMSNHNRPHYFLVVDLIDVAAGTLQRQSKKDFLIQAAV